MRVDGVTTPRSELREKVGRVRGDRIIAIRANADVPWGRVVGTMDLLVRVGGREWRLVVSTDPSRSADVQLPKVGTSELVNVVAIDRSGGTTIEGKSTRQVDLPAELRLTPSHSDRIVIQADNDAPFGAVVDLTKVLQAAGRSVGFGVHVPSVAKARVHASDWEECPFPAQADTARVDEAAVIIDVQVDPEGRARDVRVVTDPGYGFAEAARGCALRASYDSPRDSGGRAVEAQTGPFRVRFHRDPPDTAATTPTAVPSAGPGTMRRAK